MKDVFFVKALNKTTISFYRIMIGIGLFFLGVLGYIKHLFIGPIDIEVLWGALLGMFLILEIALRIRIFKKIPFGFFVNESGLLFAGVFVPWSDWNTVYVYNFFGSEWLVLYKERKYLFHIMRLDNYDRGHLKYVFSKYISDDTQIKRELLGLFNDVEETKPIKSIDNEPVKFNIFDKKQLIPLLTLGFCVGFFQSFFKDEIISFINNWFN